MSEFDIEPCRHLRGVIENFLQSYFQKLEGESPSGLYGMVLGTVEKPLLEMVMRRTKGNQCSAACLLGINRGTLRKKLAKYEIVFTGCLKDKN